MTTGTAGDHFLGMLQLVWGWLIAQPLPVQVIAAAAGLAVLWVVWILLRVMLAAFWAAFRGL